MSDLFETQDEGVEIPIVIERRQYPVGISRTQQNTGTNIKTQMQDNVFVEFMKLNQDLARGFIKGDRTIAADKRHALVCKLNAAGPPIKDIAGWKKVWLDWKMHIRKKLAHNKKEGKATGGGPYDQTVILPIEEEVAKICGLFEMVNGLEGALTFGVPEEHTEAENISQRTEEPIQTETPIVEEVAEPTPKRRKLRPQTSNVQSLDEVCAAQLDTMKTIATSLQKLITHQEEHNRQQLEHHHIVQKIEAEKLEVLKRLINNNV
ncbi:uncharacterized protein LOC120780171 [Bactrocera tryoni]|uniref:uncharacterized protein LOC120780171 n=1 Tax=Bactrocera tryoni TaxID=59916 RepID=UPI001A959DF3|nr:uncharacterized protein LOC120780171 [Bactrocera tryoni]